MTSSLRFSLALLVTALPLAAQQATPVATGSVSGHVTYGDTQRPSRFATVTLFSVPGDAGPKLDAKDIKDLGSAMRAVMGSSNMVQAQTGLDGGYSLTGVPAGDYYVFASSAGYVSPMNSVESALASETDKSKPLSGIPVAHVVADRAIIADVTMQRGAAISGKVLWDDGSPVSGAIIKIVPADKKDDKSLKADMAEYAMLMAATAVGAGVPLADDRGRYRLAGLAAGEYKVQVTLRTSGGFAMKGGAMDLKQMAGGSTLVFYAPATFHASDAKTVKVLAGQDEGDVDITLNLNATHSVSGRIASLEDHHGLNKGTVKLTDVKDSQFARSVSVDATGNYTVPFVPAGTYDLEVLGAADTEPSKKKQTGMFATDHTLKSYEKKKTSVVVADGDVTGQDLELTPSKETEEDIDMNALFGGSEK